MKLRVSSQLLHGDYSSDNRFNSSLPLQCGGTTAAERAQEIAISPRGKTSVLRRLGLWKLVAKKGPAVLGPHKPRESRTEDINFLTSFSQPSTLSELYGSLNSEL